MVGRDTNTTVNKADKVLRQTKGHIKTAFITVS